MSTYLQMQDEVLAYGFDANVYRARVKVWLNDAQSEIARRVEIPELFVSTTVTTAVGVETVTKPTDLIRVSDVIDRVTNDALEADDYGNLVTANSTSDKGRPSSYSIGASTILLSPIPDAVYIFTVLYYKRPTDLTNDADVSTVTPDYHKAMIRYALAEAYMAEDDEQMNAYHMQRFEQAVTRLATDRQAEIDDGPLRIGGTWSQL